MELARRECRANRLLLPDAERSTEHMLDRSPAQPVLERAGPTAVCWRALRRLFRRADYVLGGSSGKKAPYWSQLAKDLVVYELAGRAAVVVPTVVVPPAVIRFVPLLHTGQAGWRAERTLSMSRSIPSPGLSLSTSLWPCQLSGSVRNRSYEGLNSIACSSR